MAQVRATMLMVLLTTGGDAFWSHIQTPNGTSRNNQEMITELDLKQVTGLSVVVQTVSNHEPELPEPLHSHTLPLPKAGGHIWEL